MVKDLKTSIRNKYNRRLRSLYFILNDFIVHAEDRLDENNAGKIKNMDETLELIKLGKELLHSIPTKAYHNKKEQERVNKALCKFFDLPYNESDYRIK